LEPPERKASMLALQSEALLALLVTGGVFELVVVEDEVVEAVVAAVAGGGVVEKGLCEAGRIV